ncbi:hypothetical protein PT285_03705 [Lactobacillus sp. ESL0791]|uniref:hypothetical protein n=1 Tax=Lactobacillus sp. ESL0791 TaxID=2983234 RepID=UPI0023F7CE38|nr:hypothetical protein [Lactobacillus sp. ESL0791]MDF7638514.1 hypothetical protein [Lactobacillus sp. ESL0791]
MKKWSLGLVIGAAAGVIISLVKDKNGHRLGGPLKNEVTAFGNDVSELALNIGKLKNAKRQLAAELPAAQQTVSELNSKIKHYQDDTAELTNKMKKSYTDFASKPGENH